MNGRFGLAEHLSPCADMMLVDIFYVIHNLQRGGLCINCPIYVERNTDLKHRALYQRKELQGSPKISRDRLACTEQSTLRVINLYSNVNE
jgi:hypothetical protein